MSVADLWFRGGEEGMTFSGEIMDQACAKGGGRRGDVQEDGHQRP